MEDELKHELKYLEERIEGLDRRLVDWIEESRRTLDKADIEMNRRLESMNQFRDQISRERANYIDRDHWENRNRVVDNALRSLEEFQSNLKGRAWAVGIGITFTVAVVTAAISLAIKFF
jgi:hypothetical protein